MSQNIVSVGTIRKLVKESLEAPKATKTALSQNKKNSDSEIGDFKKQLKGAYEVQENPKVNRDSISYDAHQDPNFGMLNLMTHGEASKETKERIKKQVCGDDNGDGDNSGNKKYYDTQVKKNKELAQYNKHAVEKMPARFVPKSPLTKESVIKKLHFKNTVFGNDESKIKKLIPESYKVEGNKFIMEDKNGVQYVCVCEKISFGNQSINECYLVEKRDKKMLQEEMQRINEMFDYKPSDTIKSVNNEKRTSINEMVDRVRNLMKD